MKRLRYILWAISLCIELELHPGDCLSLLCSDIADGSMCDVREHNCILPAGHPSPHCNVAGVEWIR